jgi:predicted TIM-barrel fold metal-dependent hydrolase
VSVVIDAHMHINDRGWNPMELRQGMSQSWARQVRWYEPPKSDPEYYWASVERGRDPLGDKTIARMDEAGVTVSVMMPMDHTYNLSAEGVIPIEEKNRLCGEAAKRHAGRLFTFCGVDPRRPNAVAIFDQAVTEWGAIGLKLYPTNGFYADDEEVCYPLYRRCLAHDVPVLLHQGHSAGRHKSKYGHPIHLDAVAADFPELRLILGHGGRIETWGHEAMSMLIYKTSIHIELSLWQHWTSVDDLTRLVSWMRDRIGIDRIHFGSDMGGTEVSLTLKEWVDVFRMMPEWAKQLGYRLSREEVDMILGENTRVFYRIPV